MVFYLTRVTLYPKEHERPLPNCRRIWSHPRINSFLCRLYSRCYLVYDVATTSMVIRCFDLRGCLSSQLMKFSIHAELLDTIIIVILIVMIEVAGDKIVHRYAFMQRMCSATTNTDNTQNICGKVKSCRTNFWCISGIKKNKINKIATRFFCVQC